MGLKMNRTSFSRGNRNGHYTKNDKNIKIWNCSKWKTRITLKRRGELICLGSSRSSLLQLCVIFAAHLVTKIFKAYFFPPKWSYIFNFRRIPLYRDSRDRCKNAIRYVCQMWMWNIVVNLVRNSNHLNANVYLFITHAFPSLQIPILYFANLGGRLCKKDWLEENFSCFIIFWTTMPRVIYLIWYHQPSKVQLYTNSETGKI